VASGDADVVLVVDNGGTVDAAGLPAGVEVHTNSDNFGYAGGMNAGIRLALERGADAIALLNDDAVVTAGWAARCAAGLDDRARVGAVQPKLRLLGTDPPQINSVGVRLRGDGAGIDIGFGEVDHGQYDERSRLDLFTGGAVVLSAAFVADVGGFDERYFMYYEDIDLARRGHERGWTYRLAPGAVVDHAWSATSSADPGRRRFWQERNRLWCLARHGSALDTARGLGLSLARLVKTLARAPRHGWSAPEAQLRAIAAGVAGMPRQWRERRHPVRFAP
jgi:GT2 family glycosyltransferase